jgi:hypothetical protein
MSLDVTPSTVADGSSVLVIAARDHVHVCRRLKTRAQRPQNLVGIFDVDVFVDNDHVLPLTAPRVE